MEKKPKRKGYITTIVHLTLDSCFHPVHTELLIEIINLQVIIFSPHVTVHGCLHLAHFHLKAFSEVFFGHRIVQMFK